MNKRHLNKTNGRDWQHPCLLQALRASLFERLTNLLKDKAPNQNPIDLSLGEPKHTIPDFVGSILTQNIHDLRPYPPIRGTQDLRLTIHKWLDCNHLMTGEALTQNLWGKIGLRVLPGAYPAAAQQDENDKTVNPAINKIRLALVDDLATTKQAIMRLRTIIKDLQQKPNSQTGKLYA